MGSQALKEYVTLYTPIPPLASASPTAVSKRTLYSALQAYSGECNINAMVAGIFRRKWQPLAESGS